MTFHAVKFETNFVSSNIPNDIRLADLRNWGKIFYEKNLAPIVNGVSCGNLSFRKRPGQLEFVITGSQLGFNKELGDGAFVEVLDCDFSKKNVSVIGQIEPSSESMLHFAIYKRRSKVNCIFHGHSPEILSKSNLLELPTTKMVAPYGSIELAESVLEILEDNNFIILKDHGFIALGESIAAAGELTLKILNNCKK